MPAADLFYRLTTDNTRLPTPLDNLFAGPTPSACWLIGGGPSLPMLPIEAIRKSPVPKMSINLAGTKILRPNFWTSYDPSVRFHRSIYLDPGIIKFVHRRRAMNLVPETTFKVCDCPATFFFDRDGERGFNNFLSPDNSGIVDWADSMLQAIDILYRLGFRIIYLAGCEMRVRPSREQIAIAAAANVLYRPGQSLHDFVRDCANAGLSADQLDALPQGPHYHFDECKPIRSAANTDAHYFRVAQYLRLSRRSMSLAGMQLISVTPHSRLNDYFPYVPARKILRRIARDVGDPKREPVRGLYRQTGQRQPRRLGPMRDFRPHNWNPKGPAQNPPAHGNDHALPQNDGDLLVEAEGLQRLPHAGNGHAINPDLESRLNRLAAGQSPNEAGEHEPVSKAPLPLGEGLG